MNPTNVKQAIKAILTGLVLLAAFALASHNDATMLATPGQQMQTEVAR